MGPGSGPLPRTLGLLILFFVLASATGGCAPTTGSAGLAIDQPAPELTGTTLDGTMLSLASLRGHPVIVNFWASWCVPCRAEFPLLRTELERHSADGLQIIGVTFKDQPDAARAFLSSFGATWPTIADGDGRMAAAYRVVAPPQSYFIDRQGVLRSMQIGEMLAEDFDRQYPAIAR